VVVDGVVVFVVVTGEVAPVVASVVAPVDGVVETPVVFGVVDIPVDDVVCEI
jgi:hypothetical protein